MLLKRVAVGTATIVLGSLLVASRGLISLAIAAIAVDLSAPTDFGIGRAMGTIGLIIWTPVAVAAALALRWVWRRRNREWHAHLPGAGRPAALRCPDCSAVPPSDGPVR